jgi:hypothetical protein
VNRQVEYHEFKDIMKHGFLHETESPYFKWKFRQYDQSLSNADNYLTPELYVASDAFDNEMRTLYSKKIKAFLLDRTWYKLVDCLEEVSNYWSYGRDFTTMPTYNLYIPTRNNIMNKPDFTDELNDDLSYRFNLNRMSPSQYLNPLKAYPMAATTGPKQWPVFGKARVGKKWRRLSHAKMHSFSTVNNIVPEDSPAHNSVWYQTKFSQSTFGLF